MTKRIAITGPESTGKSTLAAMLSNLLNCPYVPEVARSYLENRQGPYSRQDLLIITKLQLQAEEEQMEQAPDYLIADTEMTVIKIWYTHAFGPPPKLILNAWEKQEYDLYLLTDIDLPWQPDPLREHPHLRSYFFNWYRRELVQKNARFEIIKGSSEERVQHAFRAIAAV